MRAPMLTNCVLLETDFRPMILAITHHVKVQKDAGQGNVGVRNNALSRLGVDDNARLGLAVLLCNQGRNVGLESSSAKTKSNDTEDEWTDGISARQDGWNGRNDEQNVTHDCEGNGYKDGVKATEVFVRDNGTDNGGREGPEGVELTDAK